MPPLVRLAPSARAAAAALALVTALAAAATALHLTHVWEAATEAEHREAAAAAGSVAAALHGPLAPEAAGLLARVAREEGLAGLALLDERGRLLAASDPTRLSGLNWRAALGGPREGTATLGGADYFLTVRPASGSRFVAALSAVEAPRAAFRREVWAAVAGGVGAWVLIAFALAAGARYAGPRAARVFAAYATRFAGADAPTGEARRRLLAAAEAELGTFAGPLAAAAGVLDRARADLAEAQAGLAEAKGHVAALLQINPHYVLLCTLDGHIVDANPAFYAVTGLPFEAVRGNRIEVLSEVFPVEHLFELARRSQREGSAIAGVEYALINRDEQRRPVHVSLRAVTVGGKEAVLIQATDVANQRTLERQISSFTDALDLMVDQRVAQLAAGNASLEGLLDAAGVVFASFDAVGRTRRWSRGAEALTGRPLELVPHVEAFTALLGLASSERAAFAAWLRHEGPGRMRTDVRTGGPPRRVLWGRGTPGDAGQADRRVLVGLELPRDAAEPPAGGDGARAPEPAAITSDVRGRAQP